MDPRALAAAVAVSALLYVLAVWFSRAGPKRAVAALVGGLVAALVNIAWDIAAAGAGWWRYADGGMIAPLTAYIPVALAFGAAAGLAGWRLNRAYGPRGLVLFVTGFALLGALRDTAYAARGTVFTFGPGLTPRLMDTLAWLSLALVVQMTMRLMVGPAAADPLARSG